MIHLENVSASYELPTGGRRTVFESLDLRVEPGEMVYLIGPSGCGKSTLLKLLYMEIKPETGRVMVDDFFSNQIKDRDIPFLRRKLGIVFQDFQLLPDRNVAENVAFTLYAQGHGIREARRKALETLAKVGLSYKRKNMPHELSGGEQQRVCIARAIVHEPRILLADEPTGNLDPAVATGIVEQLVTLNQQGMTILIATHNYAHVKQFPARTIAFFEGKLREIDPALIEKIRTP
ncbi:MAG TPA: cell division ATP-binding protein FtsE [Bacteroidetes bacterium]|nr:cell division ATP-binding protein FtsE [Bacteroidota bacterium]HRR09203.1 ATP-binding cassette domain-containing protein [Rhodothermales bacterium]